MTGGFPRPTLLLRPPGGDRGGSPDAAATPPWCGSSTCIAGEEERMARQIRRLFGVAVAVTLLAARAHAQEGTTVTGVVRNDVGAPLQLATVFLEGLGIGTTTRANGEYSLTVPAARVQGQTV